MIDPRYILDDRGFAGLCVMCGYPVVDEGKGPCGLLVGGYRWILHFDCVETFKAQMESEAITA